MGNLHCELGKFWREGGKGRVCVPLHSLRGHWSGGWEVEDENGSHAHPLAPFREEWLHILTREKHDRLPEY